VTRAIRTLRALAVWLPIQPRVQEDGLWAWLKLVSWEDACNDLQGKNEWPQPLDRWEDDWQQFQGE
jgi:hypothetical protein